MQLENLGSKAYLAHLLSNQLRTKQEGKRFRGARPDLPGIHLFLFRATPESHRRYYVSRFYRAYASAHEANVRWSRFNWTFMAWIEFEGGVAVLKQKWGDVRVAHWWAKRYRRPWDYVSALNRGGTFANLV